MDILTIVCLNTLITAFIAYVLLRVIMGNFPEIIENLKGEIKSDLETWLNSDKGQKALYQIGGLVGHGAVAGAGIQKTGGKFKWENVLGELVTSWIQGKNPLGGLAASNTEKTLSPDQIKELPHA